MSQPINGNQGATRLEPLSLPSEDERSGLQNDRCKSCLIDRKKVRSKTKSRLFHTNRYQCLFTNSSESCDRCAHNKYPCTFTRNPEPSKRRKLSRYKCDSCRKAKQKVGKTCPSKIRVSEVCSVFRRTESGQRNALDAYKVVFNVPGLNRVFGGFQKQTRWTVPETTQQPAIPLDWAMFRGKSTLCARRLRRTLIRMILH
jgi:hypothetical protein